MFNILIGKIREWVQKDKSEITPVTREAKKHMDSVHKRRGRPKKSSV